MKIKNNITKIAKHILKRQRGLRDHQIIHPAREWFIGLCTSLLILVGGAVWSTFTYLEVSERTVESASTEAVAGNVYRGDIVAAALEKFRERTDNFDQLLENRVQIVPVVVEPPINEPQTSEERSESISEVEIGEEYPTQAEDQLPSSVETQEATTIEETPPVPAEGGQALDFN